MTTSKEGRISVRLPWTMRQWQQATPRERRVMAGSELLAICWEMYTDGHIYRVFPDFDAWVNDLPHPPPAKVAISEARLAGWQP